MVRKKPRLRQPAFDCVKEAFLKICELNYVDPAQNQALRQPFVDLKKAFVSDLQLVLDPRKREDEVLGLNEVSPRKSGERSS